MLFCCLKLARDLKFSKSGSFIRSLTKFFFTLWLCVGAPKRHSSLKNMRGRRITRYIMKNCSESEIEWKILFCLLCVYVTASLLCCGLEKYTSIKIRQRHEKNEMSARKIRIFSFLTNLASILKRESLTALKMLPNFFTQNASSRLV